MIGNVSDVDLQAQIASVNNSISEAITAFDDANITDLSDGVSDLVARLVALKSTLATMEEKLTAETTANNDDIHALYAIVWALVTVVGAMLAGGAVYIVVLRKKRT